MPVKIISVSEEYIKNKNVKKEDVEALQQWINKQPHLPKLSELDIILFLHSCYNKIEATKTTIDNFFTIRAQFTEVFANRDPKWPSTKNSMECGAFLRLPQLSPDGYRLLLFVFIDPDPSKFIPTDMMKIFDMVMSLWLQEEGTAEGLVIMVDVKPLSFGHVTKMGLSALKQFFTYLQDALPVRLKGLFFFNAGSAAEKFLTICRPFIKAELNHMLHLYANIPESMYKDVPKECLPKDYGGDADSISALHDAMKKKLLDNAEYFIEDEKRKSDESKRMGRRNDIVSTNYGVDGSFKKLAID